MDVGYIRYIIDYLILQFFSASQHNYGRKMLYFRQLLTTTYEDLQKSIVTTALVSNSKKGYAVALDEQLELYNYNYSKDIAYSTNSTYDLTQTFQKISSNRAASKVVRKMQETAIGYKGSNTYSQKDSLLDVFTLGNKLFTEGLIRQQKPDSNDLGALSDNIY